jgi:hypothetical protein
MTVEEEMIATRQTEQPAKEIQGRVQHQDRVRSVVMDELRRIKMCKYLMERNSANSC